MITICISCLEFHSLPERYFPYPVPFAPVSVLSNLPGTDPQTSTFYDRSL